MQSESGQANGSSGEALLIQINDDKVQAEPVDISEEARTKDGPKVVVNADPQDRLGVIDEASSALGKSPLIAPHGENGVKNAGVEAEVGGEIEQGEEGDMLKLAGDKGKDLLG